MFVVDEDLLPVEDPCPHGIPAWLCGDLCAESGAFDDEPDSTVVDLEQAPGARLALQCQAAGAVPELLSDGEVLDVVQGIDGVIRWATGLKRGCSPRSPTATPPEPPPPRPGRTLSWAPRR